MKQLLLLFFFSSFFVGFAQVQNYEEGEVVADFTVTDVYGVEHNLYAYTASGKYVFINFFYTTCGGCQILAPIFNEFYDKYGCNESEIVCIAMNRGVDNDTAVLEFEEEHGGSFYHAPAISRSGGADEVTLDMNPAIFPTVCVIAPDNTLLEDKIYPFSSVTDLEAVFTADFNPAPANCTIGIPELKKNFSFSVYPNPVTTGSFAVKMNTRSNAIVTIYNLLGKEVFATEISNQDIEISPNLEQGSYFIQIETTKGVVIKKLLIE